MTPDTVSVLQRLAGNAAVSQLLGEQERSPVLDVIGSGGKPLDPAVRSDMEQRFGADFGDVRIHAGSEAEASAASVGAVAYTVGSEIVLGAGAPTLDSASGRHTLAHELTHVLQQRSGPVAGTDTGSGIAVSSPDDRFEQAAVRNADRVMAGGAGDVGSSSSEEHDRSSVQRSTGSAVVQREGAEGAEGAVWTVPADIAPLGLPMEARSGAEAGQLLKLTLGHIRDQAKTLDAEGEAALTAIVNELGTEVDKYSTKPSLEQGDPEYLNGVLRRSVSRAQQEIQAAVMRFVGKLEVPGGEDTSELDTLEDAYAEKLHLAFANSSQDDVAKILNLIAKGKALSGEIKSYSEKVQKVTKLAPGFGAAVKLTDVAKKVDELNKSFSEQLESAKKYVTIAQDVLTVVGADGTSNGTDMMQVIKQFQVGMKYVDSVAGSEVGKAVPFFGTLWNDLYKPLTNACINGLKVMAKADEREGRALAVWDMLRQEMEGAPRDANNAPVIPKELASKGYFPGGQAVFSYLHAVRGGRTPALPDVVRDFFLDRKELFNVEGETKAEHLQESGPDTDWLPNTVEHWFRDWRTNNVSTWIRIHITRVWAMLYGDLGQHIPH
ncbi:eCIS core domain-containing protein [Kribbella sp. CA-253562]|uniref:eCIS core domain-containing protein n=1 Tax=Kribbella sp. CA-253562 TaxID=3239942 RepID=UPI003D94FC13